MSLAIVGAADDATLARAAAAGDRVAFAGIYDRYADRLHDFCTGMLRDRDAAADCVQDVFVTAAGRLAQLREPERLRSWLYAIARNEALARIRHLQREQLREELPEMASSEPGLDTLAARNELAELISDACGGLSERDRLVFELSYRQGLDGSELSEALGVTHKNANTLVERLRETIARSLGALLVCRQVTADPDRCPELAALAEHWDGKFTVLMRKRVARHIEGCPVCDEQRARMVSPAALLGSVPIVVPAPVWLRETTLAHAGFALGTPTSTPTSPTTGSDTSWWPPHELSTTDLPDPPLPESGAAPHPALAGLRRHFWGVVGVAGIVIAAAVIAAMHHVYAVDPTSSTGHPATPRQTPATAITSTPTTSAGPTGPTSTPAGSTTFSPPPGNTGGPVVPPGTPAGPVAPPQGSSGPVVPPGIPAGPVVPPHNPGGPVVPPGTPIGPVAPPKNSGPVVPPGQPGGPVAPPRDPDEPVPPPNPPVDPGGPVNPGGPVEPPKPPTGGTVQTPPHKNPGRLGGSNDCIPPACIPTSGPIG